MNNPVSKEAFILPPPMLREDLIAYLDQNFPEKCAELSERPEEIFFRSGQRSVVRFLCRIFEEQNDNVR
jgi:hypothetical protein